MAPQPKIKNIFKLLKEVGDALEFEFSSGMVPIFEFVIVVSQLDCLKAQTILPNILKAIIHELQCIGRSEMI